VSYSPTESAERPPASELVEVTMPQMGVSVTEGTVVVWHKQPGEWVEAEETICEITTDKIDCEVPAPASGEVAELLVAPEETVPVGTPLARIAAGAPAGKAHAAEPSKPAAPDPAGETRSDPTASAAPDPASPAAAETQPDPSASAATAPASPTPRDDPESPAGTAGPRSAHYSPVVLRIAEREGVDLATVPGTGRDGRVRKQDVLAAVHARTSTNGDAAPMHIESPYREEAVPDSNANAGASGDAERLSRMRRSIAAHMTESLRTAAHCTSITEADVSRVESARRRLGLSYLPFVARCTVEALQAHPDLNATLEGEMLTRHTAVHLGIAVSLGSDGLIVPVVHDAQDLSAGGLAKRIAELARRARAGELDADDVRGGTFTITNPGGYGTIASTPIINQPQVAILDLEAVVRRPVAVSDGDGGDAVAIRPMTNLCLSWDHRALDGALAARFLGAVRERIERWEDQ
jgi:2-oxoglutarate dehydrogenase E2 component (dihydrolipoamide succinyltransferase)